MKPAHHRPRGFANANPEIVIGNFPWYDMVRRNLRGNKPADDAPWVKRLEDAHANCLENLPIFAVIVLAGAALGRLGDLQALAPWVLVARMGQSLAHLSGTGPVQVFVRATFWAAQLVLFVWMLAKLMA